jgi:hypothetical protein
VARRFEQVLDRRLQTDGRAAYSVLRGALHALAHVVA